VPAAPANASPSLATFEGMFRLDIAAAEKVCSRAIWTSPKRSSCSGHDIRTAHTGPAALQTALEFGPDLVLLDIGLPGLSGYEVARRFRGHEKLASAMLVAVTGWGSDEDRRRESEAGFDVHLTKPIEMNAIESVLAKAATRHVS
jgi:CheY-like chemotaxis protein